MQLLVSVADAADAAAAIDGGADIIDAKDPTRGPLGPVAPETLAAILATVAGRRPVSAAGAASVGLAFVKLEFGRARGAPRIAECALVLAAYADVPGYERVIDVATHSHARGVLLDTRDKQAPGLFGVLSEQTIARWVSAAQAAGLMVALAGKLTVDDIPRVEALGADIAGVRGAACDGGRGGKVRAEKVRALISRIGTAAIPGRLSAARTRYPFGSS
jgi:(5-formylfuran-3-yl)methyl phosphate synthase